MYNEIEFKAKWNWITWSQVIVLQMHENWNKVFITSKQRLEWWDQFTSISFTPIYSSQTKTLKCQLSCVNQWNPAEWPRPPDCSKYSSVNYSFSRPPNSDFTWPIKTREPSTLSLFLSVYQFTESNVNI